MCPDRSNPGRQMIWGLVLMGVGVLFLLDRAGRFDLGDYWRLWPAVFFVIGLSHLLFPSRRQGVRIALADVRRRSLHLEGRHDRIDGVIWILIGVWFFANQFGWWGFHYANSWPVMILLIGVQTVLRGLADARDRGKAEEVES